jgi:hypothetical protein
MSQKEKLQKLKGNNVKYLISLNLFLPYEKKFFNDIEILTD